MKRIIAGLGLLLGAAVAGFFQAGGLSPPGREGQPAPRVHTADRHAPPVPAPGDARPESEAEADLQRLADRLASRMERFEGDLMADFGNAPSGSHLVHDARDVSRAVLDFRSTLGETSAPSSPGRAYAEFASAWDHLQDQLSRLGALSPALGRSRARVEEVDARLRSALGVPPPPAVRTTRSRPPERRVPARWDARGAGHRDRPSQPYPVRPPDRR